jgi:hypothetical protein
MTEACRAAATAYLAYETDSDSGMGRSSKAGGREKNPVTAVACPVTVVAVTACRAAAVASSACRSSEMIARSQHCWIQCGSL